MSNALDLLTSLQAYGYKEKEIIIGEVRIKLAPLTAEEVIEVFEISSNYNDIDASIQALKIETLARSIVGLNEYRFDPTVIAKQKRDIIAKFGDDLVDLVFTQYCELDKSIKNAVEKIEGEKVEAK